MPRNQRKNSPEFWLPFSGLAGRKTADTLPGVHKDKPPGVFDLSERSLQYAAGFCFVVGFVLSVIVRIGMVLAGEHTQATPWSGF
jgi:hypothetical protein